MWRRGSRSIEMMVYRPVTPNPLIFHELLIPPRLSSVRIDGTAKRRSGDILSPVGEERSSPVRWSVHTLRCFAAAFVAARSPNEKGNREIGSRPSDCGIGQLSLTFALLRGGARIIPVTHPFFLFVSRIFISFLSFALLFFIARYFASRSSFSFFLFSPLTPLSSPTSFTFYRHSCPSPSPNNSSSSFFLFFFFSFTITLSLSFSLPFQRWE